MANIEKENITQPKTLQKAYNVIKFLETTHKKEIVKMKEAYLKQSEIIKKLEMNRKKELEFLSSELQKYEINLAIRMETVTVQLAQKDEIIRKQAGIIEDLNNKLIHKFSNPDVTIADSNSDSGVALEHEDSIRNKTEAKAEVKATRKCSRKFTDPIGFLRRVDFSPMKYKPSNRDVNKKKEEKKKHHDAQFTENRILVPQFSNEKVTSDDERTVSEDNVLSDSLIEPVIIKPKKLNDSMNNHFSDDGSEDTSEEIFDRVMTRNSIRRSVKANPKYKKINRTKSKLLEQVKVNIVD
ncbi:uncharacterized protein [Battus philenor]|uniref:uncharacterized protein n=1 Tax=Battus philenor TaxID=42288 RepID=UPI0035CEB83D